MKSKLSRRILALLLTLAMILTLVPTVFADTGFDDVKDSDWYAAAVQWAVSQNPPITNGTDATHFSPAKNCTRAEVVQFIWNAYGKAEGTGDISKFSDVKAGDWFAPAVAWAIGAGVTSGTDATHFSPSKVCTRAEVAQFLYAAAGKPAAKASDKTFPDVKDGDWFAPAVMWAVGEGITSGTGDGTFAPNKKCTRAEIVQFLYKAFENGTPGGSSDFVLAGLDQIKDGAEVVIYNAGHKLAIKNETDNDWYLMGAEATINEEEHKVVEPADDIIWTVGVDAEGNYTFSNGENMIVCWPSGNYFELTNKADYAGGVKEWKIKEAEKASYSYYIYNATLAGQYGPAWLEFYYNANKDTTKLSGYSTSEDRLKLSDFGFQFYVKGAEYVDPGQGPGPGPGPSEGDFVLAAPKDGDEVVIYNKGHELAIKNETDNDWYLMGDAATVNETEHKISNPDASIVWKVSVDAEGNYTFTNGENAINCWPSESGDKTYYELTNKADYEGGVKEWKLKEADKATYSYYIYNKTLQGQYGNIWLEFYYNANKNTTKLSAYNTSEDRLGLENFGFQFYVKGATYVDPGVGPGPGPEPGEDAVFVKLNAEPEDWEGTYVIAHEGDSVIFDGKSADDNNFVKVTIEDNKITASTDNAITIEKSGEGYTFKTATGKYLAGKTYQGAGSNGLYLQDNAAVGTLAWVDGAPVVTSDAGTVLRFNNKTYTDTTYHWFRFYTTESSVTADANTAIALYKLDESLAPTVNKAALRAAIAAAEALNPDEYTEESFAGIAEPLAAAKAVLAKEDATQEEIDAAAKALNDAIAALEKLPVEGEEFELTAELKTGDKVVIYSPAAQKAVDSTLLASYYLTATDVTLQGEKIVNPAETVVWTVTANENGTYTFDQGELTLVAYASGNYVDLGNTTGEGRDPAWVLTPMDATAKTFTVKSNSVLKGEQPVYLEWYAAKTEFSAYGSNNPTSDAFAFQFYAHEGGDEPIPTVKTGALEKAIADAKALDAEKYTEESFAAVTEALTAAEAVLAKEDKTQEEVDAAAKALNDAIAALEKLPVEPGDYVLGTELKDGDQVVIYNPSAGKAVSNADLSAEQTAYRAGVDVTPAEGTIADPAEEIIWTVELTEGGVILKDAEGHKLSMDAKGLELDKPNDVWEIRVVEGNTVALVNVNAAAGSSGDPKALEWYAKYSEFSTHYLNTEDAQFLFELYVKAEEPVEKDLEGKIVILHTNDTHGALMGFANVAALRDEYEKRGATVILVDAGDYSQGTTYVSTNKGEAAITMLNAAGYDYATLGNHEFDFGYAQLKSNMEKAEFQLLCADVLLKADSTSAFQGHAIEEVDGFKIGFFGMETPETFTKVNPGLIQEITFPQGTEMYACAQAEVNALKEEGADIIIGIVHLGVDAESEPNRSIDLYKNVEGIDFLIDGHSHTVMTEGPDGEPIQSTGTKADKTAFMNVGYIEIDPTATKKDGRIKNELIAVDENTPKDEAVAAVAQEIMDAVDAEYGAKFATSEVELNGDKAPGNRNMETNLGDLITDALRWSVLKDMDAETLGVPEANVVALTNGGGIRAWIHAGDVTKNDVNTVLPFGNTVAVVYVTGAELLEALEASTYSTPGAVGGFPQVSGMEFTINTAKAFAQGEQYPDSTYYGPASIERVTIDSINGNAFDPEATYAVVTNNFCAAGGDTYYAFKAASKQFDTGIPMDEALIDYITTELEGTIGSKYANPQGRITILEDLSGKTIILHTNDTHGALMGFAQVAAQKAFYEEQGATVILVDAGDYSQGTTYVSTNKGEAAVTMLNEAGYDYVTLGNHEFDFGYAQLKSNMEKAEFQLLCADVLLKADSTSAFQGHAIEEVNGMKIGFFGMETPETFTKVNPGLIQEITFPQGTEMYACAQAEVNALKEEGADIIIGIVHLGVDNESEPNRSIDLYKNVEGIDFLIDGHSHTVMTEGPDGEPIQSTGTKASKTAFMNVGYIEIDNTEKKIASNKLIPLGEDAKKDEAVAAVAQEIMDAVDAEYGAKFATSEVELNGDKAPGNRNMETNLGDLITDALRWSVLKDMDAETLGVPEANVVALTNGGGIRAWIHAGDVTKNDINTVLPFGNTVAVVYVTGAELLEALEASTYSTPGAVGGFPQVSGIQFNIDTTKAFDKGEQYPDSTYYGPASIKRVTIDSINGEAFDPDATYAVVTNNFCAAGGDTYYAFKAASKQFDTGIPMDEALIDFITNELSGNIGTTYAEPQGRITQEERVEDVLKIETTFPSATKADIDKYGDVHFSITSAELANAGFEYKDLVKLSFLDQEVIVPIIPQYRYVGAKAVGLVMWEDGTKPAEVEVFNGSFAANFGLADVVREGSDYTVTAKEGVEFPVAVTITMYEKQGYADTYAIFDLTRSNNREDYRGTVEPYPNLTDEEFANFREITTTGMGDGKLYRASSPINPSIGRNTYADAAAEAAGVKSFVNLADSESSAAKYAGYADSYYSKQNIAFLNLGVDFTTELNREGLKTAMEFIADESSEAPFLVHCNEGQDRAGFVSALLECLMGASYDEVVNDYMVTFYNYYGVMPGTDQYAQISNNVVKNLSTAFGLKTDELASADLAAEAVEYLKELGVSDETIAAVKAKLAGEPAEPTYVYALASELKDGDEVVIYNATNSKAVKAELTGSYYLVGEDATPVDGLIEEPAAEILWTVTKNEDGTFTFRNGENVLAAYVSGNYVDLALDAADHTINWTLTTGSAENNSYYMYAEGLEGKYGHVWLEFYNGRFSAYTTSDDRVTEAAFGMQFYAKTDASTIHTHDWTVSAVDPADCTHQEVTHYTCSCGEEKTEVTGEALGHIDEDPADGKCDRCGEDMPSEVTSEIVFGELGLENAVQYSDPFDGGNFTVTFSGGGNDGKYYNTGAGIRVYGGGTMTVAAKSGTITKIVITCANGYVIVADVSDVGTLTVEGTIGTWIGSASSVAFTRGSGSGHWRIQSVAVTVVP